MKELKISCSSIWSFKQFGCQQIRSDKNPSATSEWKWFDKEISSFCVPEKRTKHPQKDISFSWNKLKTAWLNISFPAESLCLMKPLKALFTFPSPRRYVLMSTLSVSAPKALCHSVPSRVALFRGIKKSPKEPFTKQSLVQTHTDVSLRAITSTRNLTLNCFTWLIGFLPAISLPPVSIKLSELFSNDYQLPRHSFTQTGHIFAA